MKRWVLPVIVGTIAFLIGIITSLTGNFLNFKSILTAQVPPQVFATILVSLSVIFFKYADLLREAFRKKNDVLINKAKNFAYAFSISITFTTFGLIYSLINYSGLYIFFSLIVSVISMIWMTFSLLDYFLDLED